MNIKRNIQIAHQHHQSGRLREAEVMYLQILAAHPRQPTVLHSMGILAYQLQHFDVAVDYFRKAVRARQRFPEAYNNLCAVLVEMGLLDEAVTAGRQAVVLGPDSPESHHNLGNALMAGRQVNEAIASWRKAIAYNPSYLEALTNLGLALKDTGCMEEAVAVSSKVVSLQPGSPEAHYNLGLVLMESGQIDEAIHAYEKAIALEPQFLAAHYNIANALSQKGKMEQAILAYRRVIELDPDFAEAYNNLGNALLLYGQPDEALAAYRQAIAINVVFPEALNNLGNALRDKGRLDEAVSAYRQAIDLRPDFTEAHSNLIYTLHFHQGHDTRSIQEEHSRWNQQHAEPLKKFIRPHANDRSPTRRLRIGYVSPDFRNQSECYFVVPLFEAHDKSQYEIHAYASVAQPDHITDRLRSNVTVWHDVLRYDDEALAEKIRHDGIDILVDLTMHMAHNRLLLFARKPAPIQVAWLAYPGSTGLETMDYRITDEFMDPSSVDTESYSEESVRLSDSWCCYHPLSSLAPSPAHTPHWGSFVRFASLNNFCKLNDTVLRLWAQVLGAVPHSRLLLLADEGGHRDDLCRDLEALGIERSRVEFTGKRSREEYLRLYDEIDIALDPLPYNGITTTLDAFWMGVPVVSLAGHTASGRAGLSLLSTAGLPELATHTQKQFVSVASGLALDLPRLAEMRSSLRQRIEQSPLMDGQLFARDLETAYRQMWRKWGEKQE
jgi:protein O-GlcNAc transferase